VNFFNVFFFKGFYRYFRFLGFLGFSVKEDRVQIVRPRKNILYIILYVASFLLGGWRDVRTQKITIKMWNWIWFVLWIDNK